MRSINLVLSFGILASSVVSCVSLPTMVHNPIDSNYTFELAAISPVESNEETESEASDKLNTNEKSGAAALFQVQGGLYAKLDAAPIPGMWGVCKSFLKNLKDLSGPQPLNLLLAQRMWMKPTPKKTAFLLTQMVTAISMKRKQTILIWGSQPLSC